MKFKQIEEIRRGAKVQTRRPIKPQPRYPLKHGSGNIWDEDDLCRKLVYAPCATGDIIHVEDSDGNDTGTRLRITNVRFERLREITNEEAYDEGIRAPQVPITEPDGFQHQAHGWEGIYSFRQLWNSIYRGTDFEWVKNPWVWVIEFELMEGLE